MTMVLICRPKKQSRFAGKRAELYIKRYIKIPGKKAKVVGDVSGQVYFSYLQFFHLSLILKCEKFLHGTSSFPTSPGRFATGRGYWGGSLIMSTEINMSMPNII
ncbi:MAG: hypothetical protein KJ869_01555 [Candidatus Edwardsbacteria bacterium]|nr:hypothetical protein [Candidatus Edwardsbacteria bacterium]